MSIAAHGNGWRGRIRTPKGWRWGPIRASEDEARADAAADAVARDDRIDRLVAKWLEMRPGPYRQGQAETLIQELTRAGVLKIPQLGPMRLEEIERDHAGCRWLRTLGQVLRWGARCGWPVLPAAVAWRPRRRDPLPPRPLLSEVEITAIINMARTYGTRAHALVRYLADYGARPITACRLTRGDVDAARLTLTIEHAKRSGGWTHPITDADRDRWLACALPGPSGALFPHYKEDRPWRIAKGKAGELADWYHNTIAKKLKLGKGIGGIYDLKRYAITRWLSIEKNPRTIATFTGHLCVDQVLRYSVTNTDHAREALTRRFVPPHVPMSQPD